MPRPALRPRTATSCRRPGPFRTGCNVRSLLLCGWLAACGRPAATPAPTESETSTPSRQSVFGRTEHWRFSQLNRGTKPAEEQLAHALRKRLHPMRPHDGYMCVAREAAAHLAAHHKLPDETLQRWIVGRCEAPRVFYWSVFAEIDADGIFPDGPIDDTLLQELVHRVAAETPHATAFGVAAHSAGPRAVVLLVMAAPDAELRVDGPDARGRVLIRGRYEWPKESLRALINQGRAGVAPCIVSESVALPRFLVTCTMAASDAESWVDLVSVAPGEFLESPLVSVLVTRNRRLPYRRPAVALPRGGTDAERIVSAINALRQDIGATPLEVAPEQSELVRSMMPQVFAAQAHNDPAAENALRRELLAGRNVPGFVRTARVGLGVAYAGGAEDWLAARLHQPVIRELLLDPGAELLALGTHEDAHVGFGAATALYSVFHQDEQEEVARGVYATLRAEREMLGFETHRLDVPEEVKAAAQHMMSNESYPEVVLREALNAANRLQPRRLAGVVLGASRPWRAPAEFFQPAVLECAVVAAFTRRPGAHWGESLVLLVFVQEHEPNAGLNEGSDSTVPKDDGSRTLTLAFPP